MTNWLEKHIPERFRTKTVSLIVSALGLFLALQYNTVITQWMSKILPLDTSTVSAQAIYLVILTVAIILIGGWIEGILDGK